jgi:hypothetical protein
MPAALGKPPAGQGLQSGNGIGLTAIRLESTLSETRGMGGNMIMIADVDVTGIVAILAVFGVPIVAIVAGVWHKHARHKVEADLKRQMIERGMTAEEIAVVISARPRKVPQRESQRAGAFCARCGSGLRGVQGPCPQCGKVQGVAS